MMMMMMMIMIRLVPGTYRTKPHFGTEPKMPTRVEKQQAPWFEKGSLAWCTRCDSLKMLVKKKTVFASTAWTVHHHFHHFPQCLSIHHFQVQSPVLMCTSELPPRKEPRRVATEPWCRDGRNGTRAGSLWKLVPEPERKCWARNETKAP